MTDTLNDRIEFTDRILEKALEMGIKAAKSNPAKPETKHESWLIGIFCLCATVLAGYGIATGADFQMAFTIWATFVGGLLLGNAGFRTVKKVQELKNGNSG